MVQQGWLDVYRWTTWMEGKSTLLYVIQMREWHERRWISWCTSSFFTPFLGWMTLQVSPKSWLSGLNLCIISWNYYLRCQQCTSISQSWTIFLKWTETCTAKSMMVHAHFFFLFAWLVSAVGTVIKVGRWCLSGRMPRCLVAGWFSELRRSRQGDESEPFLCTLTIFQVLFSTC